MIACRHYKISYVNLLLALVLLLLLISCKGSDKTLEESKANTVGYDEFKTFKVSVLGEISNNKEVYQANNKSFSENYKLLLDDVIELDSHLLALKNRQQEGDESLAKLEKNIKAVNIQQQSLSEKVEKYTATKNEKKKKVKASHGFPFSLSSIAIWGNHYVIYMKAKEQYVPIRINDSLGDWRLIEIDYAMKRVIFKNVKTKKSIVRKLL